MSDTPTVPVGVFRALARKDPICSVRKDQAAMADPRYTEIPIPCQLQAPHQHGQPVRSRGLDVCRIPNADSLQYCDEEVGTTLLMVYVDEEEERRGTKSMQ